MAIFTVKFICRKGHGDCHLCQIGDMYGVRIRPLDSPGPFLTWYAQFPKARKGMIQDQILVQALEHVYRRTEYVCDYCAPHPTYLGSSTEYSINNR